MVIVEVEVIEGWLDVLLSLHRTARIGVRLHLTKRVHVVVVVVVLLLWFTHLSVNTCTKLMGKTPLRSDAPSTSPYWKIINGHISHDSSYTFSSRTFLLM